MGTIIDFQSRRALRWADAADPFPRLDSAVDRLAPLVRTVDDDSPEGNEIMRALSTIRDSVEGHRPLEAASRAENLLRRMLRAI